tara:strand:+ start:1467 stop:1850 length:384 start_codon:yes stop_codon:yes gene_type:complete
MMFLILFTLLGTVLGQSQLAAITYIDSDTCNLDSEVNVELWVNSAPTLLELSKLVVNTDTTLTMNELDLKVLNVRDTSTNYLNVGPDNNNIYVKTDGDIQTTGLRITKEGQQPLILTYELLNKLINL